MKNIQEATRLFDLLYFQLKNFPQSKAFGYRNKGNWVHFSTEEAVEIINHAGRGLLKLGVKPGDRIAIAAYQNRPEWVMMDMAIQQIGAISVPVYPTISPREYEYIFNETEVKFCFVGGADLYEKVTLAQQNVASIQEVFVFDERKGCKFWKDIFTNELNSELEQLRDAVKADDLATIIYTSGTTGNPKGVMLTHHNILVNVMDVRDITPLEPGDRTLSFLPLCHIFERTTTYFYIANGVNVHYVGTDNLGGEDGDIQAVKPHFFTSVPRLLEKVYEKIYNKGLDLTGIKRTLFFWALNLTKSFEYDKQYGFIEGIKWAIADKLIFSKWRAALGGNVKGIISGAAPLPMKIAQVFSAAGIPIREGYGLTETSPGLAIGRFEKNGALLGTIGPALSNVELRIDSSDGNYAEGEGELLAKGPNIMKGYYMKPEETAKVMVEIDGDVWFKTGDIGKLVERNGMQFLKITDRKKELLKTSGGKYVAPAPIENRFKEDFLIEQIMVVGEQRKFVSALIVPAEEALKDWCDHKNIQWTTLGEVIQKTEVLEYYQKIIDMYNPEFSHIEQIKKFALVGATWEAEKTDGSEAELTPTMKPKRRIILKKHQDLIDQIYEGQSVESPN
ncbi:long-chain fatty acid--CoA ligase [Limibacter armeniacum]|uniref:AMP-dependent synthetase/ligase n=1 Tax=Limibacter armeniacum TaxID=466084 RepID=UPI002FE53E5C